MKTYSTPSLIEYGDVATVTGIFGSSATPDTSYGPGGLGDIVGTGTGSIDQCATTNQSACL